MAYPLDGILGEPDITPRVIGPYVLSLPSDELSSRCEDGALSRAGVVAALSDSDKSHSTGSTVFCGL